MIPQRRWNWPWIRRVASINAPIFYGFVLSTALFAAGPTLGVRFWNASPSRFFLGMLVIMSPIYAAGIALRRRRLRALRILSFHYRGCLSCGYDLRAVDAPRCPECGAPFDLARSRRETEHVLRALSLDCFKGPGEPEA